MKAAALVAACVSSLAGTALAQANSPSDLQPIARASATEVLLDLSVLDKHGKPVRSLKAGDIEILEDDVAQKITSFRFVGAPEAQKQRAAASAATAPAAPEARSLHAVNLVCLVFHNLDPI